jgi:protein TonB
MPHIDNYRALARPLSTALAAVLLSLGVHAAPADAVLVSQVEPEFPREAVVSGETRGKVHARVTIDASGEVVRVEILEATPRRVFDRAVVKTLSQWRFSPGAEGRTREVDVDFRR